MSVRNRLLGPSVPKMPSGLIELMDGLARDVLKNNPANIYEFCAQHMQVLLELRDGSGKDLISHANLTKALKPILTLDQKIEKAQKLVKQRAEQRQRAYEKQVREEVRKNQVIPATVTCGDGSEYSDKKETEKGSSNAQQAEITETIKKQLLEKPTKVGNETEDEKNDKNNASNIVDNAELQENEDEKKHSNQEVLPGTELENNEKHFVSTESKPEIEYTIDDNVTNNNLVENDDISNEIQASVVTPNIVEGDQDNIITNSLTDTLTELDCNVIEEKLTIPEIKGIDLHSEHTEVSKNDCKTELQNEEQNDMEDAPNKIQPTGSTEIVAFPLDDNAQDPNNSEINTEQLEKQDNFLSTNNPINENDFETALNTETNICINKKRSADLSEPEKVRDDEILTVILGSNSNEASLHNSEPDIVLSDGLDSVQITVTESTPNELEEKTEPNTDNESNPESTHDNNKTNSINSSMDLETAAITIQKVFRSFLFKTKTASYDDPTAVDINSLTEHKEKEENDVLNIKDRRPLGISRMDTVLQTVNEEKSLSLSTDDSSTLSSAATIIQAHVRGFLVRNKLNLNKTISTNSLIDSDAPSIPSLEADSDNIKSKTVLNIHIVPEGGHFVSRDESILTSMDLSLDSSPPSSVNLHPLGYDKSERRKQLKREDAIQSVSPPSNNSGKLSEDHDSVKEVLTIESNVGMGQITSEVEANDILEKEEAKVVTERESNIENSASDAASDEMDVITPYVEDKSSRESDTSTTLLHSGEFHDIVVPTNVTRSDTSIVRGE